MALLKIFSCSSPSKGLANTNDAVSTLNTNLIALEYDLTPIKMGYGAQMGGKHGGLVIASAATSFSDSVTKEFELSYTPVTEYAVLCTMVTNPSTNISIRNISVDKSNKKVSVTLTGVTGAVRFAFMYFTSDNLEPGVTTIS